MKITITEQAAAWYEKELQPDGGFVRFYVRYGGHSPVQSGFSLGVSLDAPEDLGASAEMNSVTYYVEANDIWYFDEHDLHIEYNEKYEEPIFRYEK